MEIADGKFNNIEISRLILYMLVRIRNIILAIAKIKIICEHVRFVLHEEICSMMEV